MFFTQDQQQALTRLFMAHEAKILRRVAEVIRGNYSPGCYGHGGPQDGDDIPASFDAYDTAKMLDEGAAELEQELIEPGLSEPPPTG